MLYRLTGKPQVLHPVLVSRAVFPDLEGKVTKDFSGALVDCEEWFGLEAVQCGHAFLAKIGITGVLNAELKLGYGDRRDEYRVGAGNDSHIGWGKGTPLNVDPDTGVDQEAHGSRTSSFSVFPVRRESFSQSAAASSGRVR